MKNSHRNIYIGIGVFAAGLAVLAGNSGLFKGSLTPIKTGQELHTAGVTCRTFVPPVDLAGGQAKNQLGYDSFIEANGVHPGFKDKSIVKGKDAINAWRFTGCDKDTRMSSVRFKLKGQKTYLGNVEVFQDGVNVTRFLTDESKAKLKKVKDSFSGAYQEVSTEVVFTSPLIAADGTTFSVVVEPTAYTTDSVISAVVEDYTFVDTTGTMNNVKAPANDATLHGK